MKIRIGQDWDRGRVFDGLDEARQHALANPNTCVWAYRPQARHWSLILQPDANALPWAARVENILCPAFFKVIFPHLT